MMDNALLRLPVPEGHLQGCKNEFGGELLVDGLAHH
jgi:hypothetical protein